jgi:macrolide transport system ATP-binding/permease protein
MSRSFLSVHNLTFKYPSAVYPVIDNLSCRFETGWTGIAGANGSGKTTLLKLVSGRLPPEAGTLDLPSVTLYCEQRTDRLPPDFLEMMEDFSSESFRIRNSLGIHQDWGDRWETLSHGERKRVQLASALYRQPDILAVDEPTNHLDRSARHILLEALKGYKGIGLLVSHDREFLDVLCTHTLFMQPGNIIFRKGNYSVTRANWLHEESFRAHHAVSVKRKMKKLYSEIQKRQHNAAGVDSRRSKKNLNRKDHDAKAKTDLARLSGKDAVEGRIKKRLDTQMNRLETARQAIGWKKPPPSGIRIDSGKQSSQYYLFHLSPFEIPLGDRILRTPDLFIRPGERIGLTGPNGAGKSSLLAQLIRRFGMNRNDFIFIPQELDESASGRITEEIRALPNDQLARLMTLISRLGSDPERVLDSSVPSPGETRKLMLGRGILKQPLLIIMDEPTNHMDLPSIETVEQALNSCDCAMILVSHDMRFLSHLGVDFWRIEITDHEMNRVVRE